MILRQVLTAVAYTFLFAAFLFLGAGTYHWRAGWILLGTLLVVRLWSDTRLALLQRDLVKERQKGPLQAGQPLADRVLLLAFMASYSALIWFCGADVWHWHLLGRVPLVLRIVGLLLFVAGWRLAFYALESNTFATFVVRHQEERGHHVVDQRAYAYVRHPMYAGMLPVMAGIALWLGSLAGLLFAMIPLAFLAARITVEERVLAAKVPGYDAYRKRVRYRLVPGVW